MLYEIFIALQKPLVCTSGHQMLTRHELNHAQKRLIADCRTLQNPQLVILFKKFVTHCETMLINSEQKSWLDVIFNYYVNSKAHNLDHKVVSEKLTELFCLYLQNQEPVGIATFGRVFLDQPIAFVAFIRYLQNGGMSSNQILETHLLQDFFRYYFFTLDTAQSPIAIFYQLLDEYPETKELSRLAKITCCPEEEFTYYGLDGNKAAELHVIEQTSLPVQFKQIESNLMTLHCLFGVPYLIGALAQYSNQSEVFGQLIRQQLNNSETIKTQLPELLTILMEQEKLLALLAELLTLETLSSLVERHAVGVCSLIPYHPTLIQIIQSRDLKQYLERVRINNIHSEALIPNLMILLKHIKESRESAGRTVCKAIFESIFDNPDVLEDHLFIGALRKYEYTDEFVIQTAKELENEFNLLCIEQTKARITDMDSVIIGDMWARIAKKLEYLQKIHRFTTLYPQDIYGLYRKLARQLFEHDPQNFSVNILATALKIQETLKIDEVTFYQRFLIEMLVAIDDKSIRDKIVHQLDTSINPNWRNTLYNNFCLYRHAVHEGNIGLLQWLKTSKVKSSVSNNTLAIEASQKNQWLMVTYFLQQESLQQKGHYLNNTHIQILLSYAVLGRVSSIIQYFSSFTRTHAWIDAINREFKHACINGDSLVALAFLKHLKPSEQTIATAFKTAMNSKAFEIATLLALHHRGKKMKDTIVEALFDAARHNQYEALNILIRFYPTFLGMSLIKNAANFAKRAKSNDAYDLLEHFIENSDIQHLAKRKTVPVGENANQISEPQSPTKKRNLKVEEKMTSKLEACKQPMTKYNTLYRHHGLFRSDNALSNLPTANLIRDKSF